MAAVVFHLPLFWQWTPPQAYNPLAPGFIRVTRSSEGPVTEINVNAALMFVHVEPGGLAPDERLILHYGGGESSVLADPFAEDAQVFRVAVDGDGDGVFADVASAPSLRLVARPALAMSVTISPSLATPGDSVWLYAAGLDAFDNLDSGFSDTMSFVWEDLGGVLVSTRAPLAFISGPGDRGTVRARIIAPGVPGRFRLAGSSARLSSAESNPVTLRARVGSRKLVWADLHGHSALSDGTGSADDYHFYAWRVAGLGAGALTDHDRHGMAPLDSIGWQHQREVAAQYDRPGEYSTLLGYEYTNWISGHRNVYFPSLEGSVFAAADSLYDTPVELWDALASTGAITVPHHTAGEPVRVDWDHHAPNFEPLVEITSVHGVSERIGAPDAVRGATAGHTALDALQRGYRLGFIGAGDGHVGHPGRQLSPFPWGLCGLWVEDHTRAGVFEALCRRSAFATNGPRIIVRFSAAGVPMGSFAHSGLEGVPIIGEVLGTAPLAHVEVVRNGEVRSRWEPRETTWEHRFQLVDPGPTSPNTFYYMRAVQEDGGTAWSSPVWLVDSSAPPSHVQALP